jgi:recombinational DNA repair protein RecR
MDTEAHRILKRARDDLVEGFRLGLIGIGPRTGEGLAHGMTEEQESLIDGIIWQLWDVMDNDPSPPDCQECATPIEQPATGRPRRFCSDACRQRNAYYAKG